jgi:hypothetical protein
VTDWDEITAAVGIALSGEKERGRHDLTACWDDTSEQDHAKRCVIAQYLADLQEDLDAEVAWDERALAAYARVADDDFVPIGIPSARGLAPSLHLNLGDGYLRQGRVEDAQAQLDAGLAQDVVGEDGYGRLIRTGLAGLAERLEAARSNPAGRER